MISFFKRDSSPIPENGRILIIKTQAIGDLLMATPAIRDIRRAFPRAHLTLMTGSWSAPAVRKNPHLDHILEFEDRVLLDRRGPGIFRLLLRVRRGKFDAAIIFHPSPFFHLFAMLAAIPRRYGLLRAGARNRFLTAGVEEDLGLATYYPVNFQKVAALSGAIPGSTDLEVHYDAADATAAAGIVSRAGFDRGEGFILVAPGGGRNSKEDVAARRWPVEHFVELLREIKRERPGLGIVLTGAAGDAVETGRIARAFPDAVDCTARTSLTELYALVGMSRGVVCNDSSLLHIAMARKKPAIVPFGPTGLRQRLPGWAAPFSRQSEIACSPCYVGGAFPGCPIRFQCMREMRPETLLVPLRQALDLSAPGK